MAEAKQIFEAAVWFRNGLPAGNDYSRETAEANCKAAIGLASTKHRVLFGPLRWSEFDADDARAPTPPAEAPPGVKLLHVEAAVVGPWIAPWEVEIEPIEPPTVPSSGKIPVGVHGDFTRYRYTRDDKQLWCDALAALGGGTWRDLRRQHRELRERLDFYAAWRALWDASAGAASVRKRLMTVIKASDSLSAARRWFSPRGGEPEGRAREHRCRYTGRLRPGRQATAGRGSVDRSRRDTRGGSARTGFHPHEGRAAA